MDNIQQTFWWLHFSYNSVSLEIIEKPESYSEGRPAISSEEHW